MKMFKKFILGITAFVFASTFVQAGVGILEASKQAGFEISCPDNIANCVDSSAEAEEYSIIGTQNFMLSLLGGVLDFAAIIAVVMVVIVGMRLVIAMGNQEALQAAKKQAAWILGGLAVIILSLLIVRNITEKIYEVSMDCLSVAEDGLYSDATSQAADEAWSLAGSWCADSWNLDGVAFDENILGFQKEFNQLECVDEENDWQRVDVASTTSQCGTTVVSCLTLFEDGKHGPKTEAARLRAPNLAAKHSVGDASRAKFKAYREIDPKVMEFQKEYNYRNCQDLFSY